MHDSLTIALLQAREAAMAYFRPIVKRHNLTEQQWRIVRIAGTALYESAQAEVEETYRLLEAQFTTEKLQQLTSLLEEFIALGVPAGRGDEEE